MSDTGMTTGQMHAIAQEIWQRLSAEELDLDDHEEIFQIIEAGAASSLEATPPGIPFCLHCGVRTDHGHNPERCSALGKHTVVTSALAARTQEIVAKLRERAQAFTNLAKNEVGKYQRRLYEYAAVGLSEAADEIERQYGSTK